MTKIKKPAMRLTVHGDIVKRANLFRWIREFIEAQNIGDGYYLEFGVLNGECFMEAFRQMRGVVSHYVGFDSFEGLPNLSTVDETSQALTPAFYKGNFQSMPENIVKEFIKSSCRIQEDEMTMVKGFFDKSLPNFDKQFLRSKGVPLVIYIDCDLYSSTVEVLNFIDDLLVTGTWILFDDYWFYRGHPMHGQQRAITEWLDGNERIGLNEYCNFEGWSKAFIVYEK